MDCKVSGKQINVGDSLTEYIKESLTRVVQKHHGKNAEISAIISKDNGIYSTELLVHIKRGITFNAHGEDADPYLSVDDASKKIAKQLQKNKVMIRSNKTRISELLFKTTIDSPESNSEFYGNTDAEPLVIADIVDNLPSMTVKEASEILTNSTAHLLVFKNGTKVNVVYWRKDGNIGWVES